MRSVNLKAVGKSYQAMRQEATRILGIPVWNAYIFQLAYYIRSEAESYAFNDIVEDLDTRLGTNTRKDAGKILTHSGRACSSDFARKFASCFAT